MSFSRKKSQTTWKLSYFNGKWGFGNVCCVLLCCVSLNITSHSDPQSAHITPPSVGDFISVLHKYIKAIDDCGSSSLTVWTYSSSVHGGLIGFSRDPPPPQTLGNLEEEQLNDPVSTLPLAAGRLGKSRGNWKTKHDSTTATYGTGEKRMGRLNDEEMRNWHWWACYPLQSCTHVETPVFPHSLTTPGPKNTPKQPQVSINICCTRTDQAAC